MAAGWRAVVTATTVSVVVTAGVALAHEGAPTPPPPQRIVTHVRHGVSAAPPAPPALPPVRVAPVDPALLASAPDGGAAGAVTQTVQLTIVGGELTLVHDEVTVVLTPAGSSGREWSGTLPPVRVVDARGTHEGWTVRWSVHDLAVAGTGGPRPRLPDATVHLTPGEPGVVAGLPDGLVTGQPGPAVRNGRVLFGAEPGWGGGTYEAGAEVLVRLPAHVDASSVAVTLRFSLA